MTDHCLDSYISTEVHLTVIALSDSYSKAIVYLVLSLVCAQQSAGNHSVYLKTVVSVST